MADVKSTFNGKNSRVATRELDNSKPLINKEDHRDGMDVNTGMGKVFAGSPNNITNQAPIVRAGGSGKKMC